MNEDPPSSKVETLLNARRMNFDGVAHEFRLLHDRVALLVTRDAMYAAVYATVYYVGTKSGTSPLIIHGVLAAIGAIGLFSVLKIAPGVREALVAINQYIANDCHIEEKLRRARKELLDDISLGRDYDSLGKVPVHEASVRFYRLLVPELFAFWVVLLALAAFM
jgi:hypothetical protein